MRHAGTYSLLLIAMLAGSGRAEEEFNPYEIPQEQFTARVRVIALRPPRVPADVADPAAVREVIDARLTEGLRDKGYTVVPASAYAALWRQMSERLGGTYDPVTGAPREEQHAAARDHVARELKRLYRADAILSSFVTVEWAPHYSGGFAYRAMDEDLTWQGAPIGGALINHPQKVLGAYLNVVISDLVGAELYGVRAPIQWFTVYAARGYEERPTAERLATPWPIKSAIDKDLVFLVDSAAKASARTP